jgi:hypothetical protein
MSSSDEIKFNDLCKLKYADQAVWFANGFWEEVKANNGLENLWQWAAAFAEIDKLSPARKGVNGNQLDQFWSAKFLEDNDKAITALERKAALKEIDKDNNGFMALIVSRRVKNREK